MKPRPISLLLLTLTFTTGLVDAVSILGLGQVFTALMTGNVVFVGLSLVGTPGMSAGRSLAALTSFAFGAFLGGRIAARWMAGPLRGWLLRAAAMEAALLSIGAAIAFGAVGKGAAEGLTLYALIVVNAMAMGSRSATMVKLKDPDLKTTVLTLTLTAVAADSPLTGGDALRWGRRWLAIVALAGGALVGAVLLQRFGMGVPLALMAALVLGSTVLFARHPASAAAR